MGALTAEKNSITCKMRADSNHRAKGYLQGVPTHQNGRDKKEKNERRWREVGITWRLTIASGLKHTRVGKYLLQS